MRYLFEDYTFDTERRELHRAADAVSITPQVFDLLDYLIRNRERVVSKDDLIRAVWKGRIVSDAALTTRLNAARNAIGDSGEMQRLIKTLPRIGFRFVGTVQEAPLRLNAAIVASPSHQIDAVRGDAIDRHRPDPQEYDDTSMPSRHSPPPLSMAVLPFGNLSGDPAQDYFVDGVTDSLTTDLSRISGSFVIARNSAFSYKGKSIDVRQVGRELNIRYVLEGSVQRSGNRVRVNVQLVDTETASHLWAERFDKPVADLFDMQDEIVSRLANTLKIQLIEAEARRAERSPHPNSMDLYFRGIAWLNKGPTPDHLARARGFFESALVLDPENVEALVGLAQVDVTFAGRFLCDDGAARFAVAETTLTRALSLFPDHALAHMFLGGVQICTNRAALGIAECERALELNRNLADAHAIIGWAKILIGRSAETEAHVQEALRLSPRDSGAYRWLHELGIAKLMLGADVEAVELLRRSLECNRNNPIVYFQLGAALLLLQKTVEASAAIQEGLTLDPKFTIRRMGRMSDHPIFRAGSKRIRDAMRTAGVPEG